MRHENERFAERFRRRIRGSIADVSAGSIARDKKGFQSCKALITVILLGDCATLICYMFAKFGGPHPDALYFALRIDGISGFLVLVHVVWICQLFIDMRKIVLPNAPSLIYLRKRSSHSSKNRSIPHTEIIATSRHHLLRSGEMTSTRKMNMALDI